MSAPQMTTVERLRQVVVETIQIDVASLQVAIGRLVVSTSAEYPAATADACSVRDAAAGVTVLLADRIPAGQETKALADAIERHHGSESAMAVLGDQAADLLRFEVDLSGIREYSHEDEVMLALPAMNAVKGLAMWCLEDGDAKLIERFEDFAHMPPDRFLAQYEKGHERELSERIARHYLGFSMDIKLALFRGWVASYGGQAKDGNLSIYTDPNEFLLSEYSKYAEYIAEGDPMAFDDWLAGSDLPEIVKAREVAKVQERNLSNNTEHTELPPIKSNVSVRLVDGVVVNGVVTEHGQKDGKPTFDFDYYHRTHDGQTIKASKWAWPAMVVQRKPTNFIEQSQQPVSAVAARIAEALPANSGYEKGYKDALESLVLALAPKMAASLDEAVETALDAYSNNVDDPSPAGEQPVQAVSDATLLSEINRRGMLQPLYGAIGAMHDHLDRTGALDEHLTQYLTYRLRREEAAITGMPDSEARVANWQECIDQLDREARAVKVEDSPSPGM